MGIRPGVTPADLTERQREVLRLTLHSYHDTRIAAGLFLARRTVKSHLLNAYAILFDEERPERPHLPAALWLWRWEHGDLRRGCPPAEQEAPPLVPDLLTPRQREVLALVALGLSNKQIARRLGIAIFTVKGHLRDLYKLVPLGDAADYRVAAAVWYVRELLVRVAA